LNPPADRHLEANLKSQSFTIPPIPTTPDIPPILGILNIPPITDIPPITEILPIMDIPPITEILPIMDIPKIPDIPIIPSIPSPPSITSLSRGKALSFGLVQTKGQSLTRENHPYQAPIPPRGIPNWNPLGAINQPLTSCQSPRFFPIFALL
jgi:hypothetical protein